MHRRANRVALWRWLALLQAQESRGKDSLAYVCRMDNNPAHREGKRWKKNVFSDSVWPAKKLTP